MSFLPPPSVFESQKSEVDSFPLLGRQTRYCGYVVLFQELSDPSHATQLNKRKPFTPCWEPVRSETRHENQHVSALFEKVPSNTVVYCASLRKIGSLQLHAFAEHVWHCDMSRQKW